MRIGIIGSGDLARTLAVRLAGLGHQVAVAERATDSDAVAASELVLLAMPFRQHTELPPDAFAGKIVVDATDYYADSGEPVEEIDAGTTPSSEVLARHLAGARLVKAFNTISFRTIGEAGRLSGDVARVAIPIAGDDPGAKAIVAELIADLGFDPVDVGGLAGSWRLQPGTPVYGVESDEEEIRRIVTSI
jgi:hypothetical protein